MKKYLFVALLSCIQICAPAQCLVPGIKTDSLFPVINRFNETWKFGENFHDVSKGESTVFGIIKNESKYYLFGNFTNLSVNQGPGLVLDTLTNSLKTTLKWKFDGVVEVSIPDGQGGFYVGGSFTKIGDSSRKYLAQINSSGEPTSWNPNVDSTVHALYQRNDTLFIAGDFNKVGTKNRNCFTMYSLSGDSAINLGNSTGFNEATSINSFLIKKDTLIFAGKLQYGLVSQVRKYNFKDGVFLFSWNLLFEHGWETKSLQFNNDSTTLLFIADPNYAGQRVMAVSYDQGKLKYNIIAVVYRPGVLYDLQTNGNKGYLGGQFEEIRNDAGTRYIRKGFVSFDLRTGAILNDDIKLDGYAHFLDIQKGKLFISGKFTTVNASPRDQFAVLDTGNLSLLPWQLNPTDPVSTISFSSANVFIGGVFYGINSSRRKNFAIIDSATNTILPSVPVNPDFSRIKRMLIKGDSLFVLGISGSQTCVAKNFFTRLRLYRLSTGEELPRPQLVVNGQIDDCVIDGNFLYVSAGSQLRRYFLHNLTREGNWGYDFQLEHTPTYIMVEGDKIYTVGDNRYLYACSQLTARRGRFVVYEKGTGIPLNNYFYRDKDSISDVIAFDHALLSNGIIYIQGYFNMLNGKSRRNFAALNIHTGVITNWETPFPPLYIGNSPYSDIYTDLKLFNGKIWFSTYAGLHAIDTVTGNLMPELTKLNLGPFNPYTTGHFTSTNILSFLFDSNNLVLAGVFGYVNGSIHSNLAKVSLVNAISPTFTGGSISGPAALSPNSDLNTYYIPGANIDSFTYNWSYTGTGIEIINNGHDTILLKVASNATSGILKVYANNYCGDATAIQKNISITIPTAINPVTENVHNVYVYPNPVSDILTIDSLNLADKWETFEIRSVDGKLNIPATSINNRRKVSLHVSKLSNGLYFILLRSKSGKHISLKFLKQ
jgi:hypothetical protein